MRHGLEPGSYDMCVSCGHPISDADKDSPKYESGISCPHCFDEPYRRKESQDAGEEAAEGDDGEEGG